VQGLPRPPRSKPARPTTRSSSKVSAPREMPRREQQRQWRLQRKLEIGQRYEVKQKQPCIGLHILCSQKNDWNLHLPSCRELPR